MSRLDALVSVLEAPGSGLVRATAVRAGLEGLLARGDVPAARTYLDAAELRYGAWTAEEEEFAAIHVIMLLAEHDLESVKFLRKRLRFAETASLKSLFGVYEKIWEGDSGFALQAIRVFLEQAASPALKRAFQLLEERYRARQLHLMKRAFSTISVQNFARFLGLASPAEVNALCAHSPTFFTIREGFVHVLQTGTEEHEDLSEEIEKLARLVVFLEGETGTFISSKLPTSSTATMQ